MSKFVYSPPDGEPESIIMFGQKWVEGKTADLRDEGFVTLAMGHPFFERKDKPKDDTTAVDDAGGDAGQQGTLRTPQQAKLGEGDKPDTGGPVRPVAPNKDPAPGAGETRA